MDRASHWGCLGRRCDHAACVDAAGRRIGEVTGGYVVEIGENRVAMSRASTSVMTSWTNLRLLTQ